MWEGGDPPALPQPERGGIVGRAALTASGSANTRPIMKGVRVREALLCDELPPPPEGAGGTPDLSPTDTTREVVEALTEEPGSSCATCHTVFLNPLGFVTENVDGLGRYRTHQVLFDPNGNVTAMREVDTQTLPLLTPDDEREISSAAELTAMMVESGQVQTCLARNYVRWTFGREEHEAEDACVLEDVSASVLEAASIQDVMRSIAMRDEFRNRHFNL